MNALDADPHFAAWSHEGWKVKNSRNPLENSTWNASAARIEYDLRRTVDGLGGDAFSLSNCRI